MHPEVVGEGSARIAAKSNEIPTVRDRFPGLDALNTQAETARPPSCEVAGRAAETVALFTRLPPAELSAARPAGCRPPHRRLPSCETAPPCGCLASFARLANSLIMEGRSPQPKPAPKSTTGFTVRMAAEHARRVPRTGGNVLTGLRANRSLPP